jgi:hypothetical protein
LPVVNLPERWAAVDTGDNLPPRLVCRPEAFLRLDRGDIIVGEGLKEERNPPKESAEHDEYVFRALGRPERGEVPLFFQEKDSPIFLQTQSVSEWRRRYQSP